MDLFTTVLSDIWNHINESVNWIVFLLVISSGYGIRSFKMLKNVPTIKKVVIFSFSVSVVYAIVKKMDPGVFIASYFLAFGFHTLLIKWIDKKLLSVIRSKSIGGGGHQKPPKKEN